MHVLVATKKLAESIKLNCNKIVTSNQVLHFVLSFCVLPVFLVNKRFIYIYIYSSGLHVGKCSITNLSLYGSCIKMALAIRLWAFSTFQISILK